MFQSLIYSNLRRVFLSLEKRSVFYSKVHFSSKKKKQNTFKLLPLSQHQRKKVLVHERHNGEYLCDSRDVPSNKTTSFTFECSLKRTQCDSFCQLNPGSHWIRQQSQWTFGWFFFFFSKVPECLESSNRIKSLTLNCYHRLKCEVTISVGVVCTLYESVKWPRWNIFNFRPFLGFY